MKTATRKLTTLAGWVIGDTHTANAVWLHLHGALAAWCLADVILGGTPWMLFVAAVNVFCGLVRAWE
jgi:hypothetical protein